MRHILNPKNYQPLDKNLNLAMPTFGPTNREYYTILKRAPIINILLSVLLLEFLMWHEVF